MTGDEPQLEYHLTDHLGNIVVYFSDVDDDGEIATEEQTSASGEAAEVLQRNYYYPFGLRVDAPVFQSSGDPVNRYLYMRRLGCRGPNRKRNCRARGIWRLGGFIMVLGCMILLMVDLRALIL